MNVGSLFSGIGGMDAGLARAGHEHVFFCESDPWRREVLAARWPGVPIFCDVREVGADGFERDRVPGGRVDGAHAGRNRRSGSADLCEGAEGAQPGRLRTLGGSRCDEHPERQGRDGGHDVDLLCGGFPCQDLSVAGQRRGLAGDRSGLFFEFARIIDAFQPGWVLVENVPGLLSSNGGRDFGVVLGTLADLGYGVAWRILDSRFFGVPQRRRRVFIVGAKSVGDPEAAAHRAGQVLAVGSRCPGHPATRGEARPDAAVASLSGLGTGGPDDNDAQAGRVIAKPLLSNKTSGWRGNDCDETFIAETLREHPRPGSNSNGQIVAAPLTKGSATGEGVNQPGRRQEDDVNIVSVSDGVGVRRLTPVECERLQGLPDGWTDLGNTPDSRRYSALGDAVTATVAEWIGRRLA